jgi:hypothetical protein
VQRKHKDTVVVVQWAREGMWWCFNPVLQLKRLIFLRPAFTQFKFLYFLCCWHLILSFTLFILMPLRSLSAPVRRPPATTGPTKPPPHTPSHTPRTQSIQPSSSTRSVRATHTPSHPSSSSSSSSTRSARSQRNTLLDDFTSKFIKTRNELHARNQQCEHLAQEIEKYKKVNYFLSLATIIKKRTFIHE